MSRGNNERQADHIQGHEDVLEYRRFSSSQKRPRAKARSETETRQKDRGYKTRRGAQLRVFVILRGLSHGGILPNTQDSSEQENHAARRREEIPRACERARFPTQNATG
jgi:hypothetical protein